MIAGAVLRLGLILLALLSSSPAPAGEAWRFELASLDGVRFVRSDRGGYPLLVNFWSVDCPPCLAELPHLQAFAEAQPQWRVLLITADAPREASALLERLGIRLPALRGGAGMAALMRKAGNRRGLLPFSLALDQTGHICARHLGQLTAERLADMQQACKAEGSDQGSAVREAHPAPQGRAGLEISGKAPAFGIRHSVLGQEPRARLAGGRCRVVPCASVWRSALLESRCCVRILRISWPQAALSGAPVSCAWTNSLRVFSRP